MSTTIHASIITIGDELLIGQTIDTNSAYIAQELNRIGIWVHRRVAVGDVYDDIWSALDQESAHSSIVLITGGLGPTADDITKPLLCKYFDGKMIVNTEVLDHVKYLFEQVFKRPGPILERNLKQAEVPDTCTVLQNKRGTAPGMLFKKNNSVFISMPGVPHEMKGLMTDAVIPYLRSNFNREVILHKTAVTFGQGESALAESLSSFENSLPSHIKLAYLPNYGSVKLRLTMRGSDQQSMEAEMSAYFLRMQALVKEFLVSDTDRSLEEVIGEILLGKKRSMGTAESCTGGYIAHRITSHAGSSAFYKGSVISYDNEVKENILHVKKSTLETYGAVSEETVKEMVEGGLAQLKTDFMLAVSGIMGPGGGSAEKPVGTVWIAAGNHSKTETLQLHLRFDRARNISITTNQALNFLRKFILANS